MLMSRSQDIHRLAPSSIPTGRSQVAGAVEVWVDISEWGVKSSLSAQARVEVAVERNTQVVSQALAYSSSDTDHRRNGIHSNDWYMR